MGAVKFAVESRFVGKRSLEKMADAFRELGRAPLRVADGEPAAVAEPILTKVSAQNMLAEVREKRLITTTQVELDAAEEKFGAYKEIYPVILVVVVTNVTTEASRGPIGPGDEPEGEYADAIECYIELLERKYPQGKIDPIGVVPQGEKKWMSEEEFMDALEKNARLIAGVKAKTGFEGYDQIHIVGHGDPGIGLQFDDKKGGRPCFQFIGERVGERLADYFPLREDGLIVLQVCYGDAGLLTSTLKSELGNDREGHPRVYGPPGRVFIRVESEDGGPDVPKWHLDPTTKAIEDFLDRKFEE